MPSLGDALSGLQYVGESLDKPGRAVRGGLSGNFRELLNLIPFSDAMGLTDASEAVSGRDLLEKYAGLAPNEDGLDAGDIGGFAAEMALDPLNLIGGLGLAKRLMGISKAKAANQGIEAANALSHEQRAAGFMPEEIAKLTKIVDETGQPKKMYHGGPNIQFDKYDLSKASNRSAFAKGFNFTDLPEHANNHAMTFRGDSPSGWVHLKGLDDTVRDKHPAGIKMQFLDIRNPAAIEHSDFGRMPEWNDLGVHLMDRDELVSGGFDGLVHSAYEGTPETWLHYHPKTIPRANVAVALDPSQVYLPYIAKELQDLHKIPRSSPLIAALLGQNALARPDWEAMQ